MSLKNLLLFLVLVVAGASFLQAPAHALPLLPKPTGDAAGGLVQKVYGMHCKRTWEGGRGWHKDCRRTGWSEAYLADLRPHPNLRPRCWSNRWDYVYCPDAGLWANHKFNKRCRVDRRGRLHCPDR
ncbi:MAG: hypothetical protein ACR2PO_10355 [Methyloligellaceae bacterium]